MPLVTLERLSFTASPIVIKVAPTAAIIEEIFTPKQVITIKITMLRKDTFSTEFENEMILSSTLDFIIAFFIITVSLPAKNHPIKNVSTAGINLFKMNGIYVELIISIKIPTF